MLMSCMMMVALMYGFRPETDDDLLPLKRLSRPSRVLPVKRSLSAVGSAPGIEMEASTRKASRSSRKTSFLRSSGILSA